jgi:hypothetical protein
MEAFNSFMLSDINVGGIIGNGSGDVQSSRKTLTSTSMNVDITQLDKGLHSSDIGKQCEAIVQMGNWMKEYPFPHIVNTILLKLADVFQDWYSFHSVFYNTKHTKHTHTQNTH